MFSDLICQPVALYWPVSSFNFHFSLQTVTIMEDRNQKLQVFRYLKGITGRLLQVQICTLSGESLSGESDEFLEK